MAGDEKEDDDGEEADAELFGAVEDDDEVVEAVGGDDADEGASEVGNAGEAAADGDVEAVCGDAGEGDVHEVGGDEAADDDAAAGFVIVVEVFFEGEAEADEGTGEEGVAGFADFEEPGEEGDEEEEFAEFFAQADAAEEVPEVVGEGGVFAEAEVVFLEGDKAEGGPDAGDAGDEGKQGEAPTPATGGAGELDEDDVPEGGGEEGEAEFCDGEIFEAELDEHAPLEPDIAGETGGVVDEGWVGVVDPAGGGEHFFKPGNVLQVDGPMEGFGAGGGGVGEAEAFDDEGAEGEVGAFVVNEELGEELVGEGGWGGLVGGGLEAGLGLGGGFGVGAEGAGDVVFEEGAGGGVGGVAVEERGDGMATEGEFSGSGGLFLRG